MHFCCLNGCNCEVENINKVVADAPDFIKEKAANFAELYKDSETEYLWGGQDSLRSIKIDCSGLVVMCYKYAVVDTQYELLFNDATSNSLYKNFTKKTETPSRGDLIFFANDGINVNHVGIFLHFENDNVFFIDSTEIEELNINGVTERSYKKNNNKIFGYGSLLVSKK